MSEALQVDHHPADWRPRDGDTGYTEQVAGIPFSNHRNALSQVALPEHELVGQGSRSIRAGMGYVRCSRQNGVEVYQLPPQNVDAEREPKSRIT
ncbi:MAG: hypothetical protein RLN85_02580 [Pseudomonadales bacterium]